jgi:predicted nucleic acid-binding protein
LEQLLVDTNFVYAVLYRRDKDHAIARAYYEASGEKALRPSVTWPEIAYLVHRVGGTPAVIEVMKALKAEFALVETTQQDYDRAIEIPEKYADSRIDFVDACIMAMAERLKITRILTFDRRDFGLYRPAHSDYFELLPEPTLADPAPRSDRCRKRRYRMPCRVADHGPVAVGVTAERRFAARVEGDLAQVQHIAEIDPSPRAQRAKSPP